MGFETFVSIIAKQQPEEMNPHWRSQFHNLFCDVIEYDRYMRFENLEAELDGFMRLYTREPEIRSVHKNQGRAGQKLASYYTPALEKLVRDKYKIDFEFFGYPLDLPV
jgi:hypothetical protein